MPDQLLHCTFCRRDQDHVAALVAGPGVLICDRCTDLATRAIRGEAIPDFPGWDALDDQALLASLTAAEAAVRATTEAVGDLVVALRRRGLSWQRIGDALGTSRQAAWERFASLT